MLAEEAIANANTSVLLPHGIDHLLGLQVHYTGGHFNSTEGICLRRRSNTEPYAVR